MGQLSVAADGTTLLWDGVPIVRGQPVGGMDYNRWLRGTAGDNNYGGSMWREVQSAPDDSGRSNSTYELTEEGRRILGNRDLVPQVGTGGYAEARDLSLLEYDPVFGLVSRRSSDGSTNISAADDHAVGLRHYLPYILAAAAGGLIAGLPAAGAATAEGTLGALGGETLGAGLGEGLVFPSITGVEPITTVLPAVEGGGAALGSGASVFPQINPIDAFLGPGGVPGGGLAEGFLPNPGYGMTGGGLAEGFLPGLDAAGLPIGGGGLSTVTSGLVSGLQETSWLDNLLNNFPNLMDKLPGIVSALTPPGAPKPGGLGGLGGGGASAGGVGGRGGGNTPDAAINPFAKVKKPDPVETLMHYIRGGR